MKRSISLAVLLGVVYITAAPPSTLVEDGVLVLNKFNVSVTRSIPYFYRIFL
jgi:hypothetical protein